jgi:hypothetical protein
MLFISLLAIFGFASLALGQEEVPSDVAVLNDANFDTYVGTHSVTFVKFYAPWYFQNFPTLMHAILL